MGAQRRGNARPDFPSDVPEIEVIQGIDPAIESGIPQMDVGRSAAAGVVWMTIQKWAIRVLSFVTIAVLTRC